MRSTDLSRRAFLGAGLAAGGAAALAACGGSSSSGSSTTSTRRGPLQALTVSSDLYVDPRPQRFAFIFTRGEEFVDAGEATISIRPRDGAFGDVIPATLHTEGLPAGRGIFTAPLLLPRAGVWEARATLDGRSATSFFQVSEEPVAPILGDRAPDAASPTSIATLGVDPICTREPACGLHAASLSDVIGKGRPVAVMFATPARCQTRYCGPVLDQLLAVAPDYAETIDVVHVEIYASTEGTQLVPTVGAWGLDSEPWLFTVGADGTVQERLDGAFATDEIRGLLDRVGA